MVRKKKSPAMYANHVPGTNDNTIQKKLCAECPLQDNWLTELQTLCSCKTALGFMPDLDSMTLTELRGLYCFLKNQDK